MILFWLYIAWGLVVFAMVESVARKDAIPYANYVTSPQKFRLAILFFCLLFGPFLYLEWVTRRKSDDD